MHAFTSGFSKAKADEDNNKQFNPHAVSTILADPLFHAYNMFLLSVGNTLKQLCSWVESCPCHGAPSSVPSVRRRAKKQAGSQLPSMLQPMCLVAGCRAPELAAGALEARIADIAATGYEDLLASLPQNLSGADRLIILNDFGMARAYLELGLRLKFDCWRRLPWRLAGLAHPDHAIKVAIAAECLELYDASIRDGFHPTMHHPLTAKLLQPDWPDPDSGLRCDVEMFAMSGIMSERLSIEAAQLKLVPIAERAPPPPPPPASVKRATLAFRGSLNNRRLQRHLSLALAPMHARSMFRRVHACLQPRSVMCMIMPRCVSGTCVEVVVLHGRHRASGFVRTRRVGHTPSVRSMRSRCASCAMSHWRMSCGHLVARTPSFGFPSVRLADGRWVPFFLLPRPLAVVA